MIVCRPLRFPAEARSQLGPAVAMLCSRYQMHGGRIVAIIKEDIEEVRAKMGVNAQPLVNAEGKNLAELARYITYEIYVEIPNPEFEAFLLAAEQSMFKQPGEQPKETLQ